MRRFRPQTTAELTEWVRSSARAFADEGMPIVTGERRDRKAGAFADLPRLAVSTWELADVVEFRPADLTITVQAGMRLSALREVVDAERLWLPIAGAPRDRSVGGWIAAAPAGEHDDAFGPVRRHVVACDLVLWNGTETRWGRPVMKNVAGYDVAKLVCGSRARLGLVTQATLRLWPRPRCWHRLHLEREDSGDGGLDLATIPRCEGLKWRAPSRDGRPGRLTITLIGGPEAVSARGASFRHWAERMKWAVTGEAGARSDPEFDASDADVRSSTSAAYRITFGRRYLAAGLHDLERRLAHEVDSWSIEAYPLTGVVRVSTAGQRAAGQRYAPAWLTTLPDSVGRPNVPEPTLERPAVRIERGGESEHEAAGRLRSTAAREIERRWVDAFGGLEAPWQADYL